MLFFVLLAIQFLIFFLLRLLFLFWHWGDFQTLNLSQISDIFVIGTRVDLVTLSWLSTPAFLSWVGFADFSRFRRSKPPLKGKTSPTLHSWAVLALGLIFLLFQLPAVVFTGGDTEFVNFTGRRFTYDSLFYIAEAAGKWGSLIFGQLLLSIIVATIVFINLYLVFNLRKFKWSRPNPWLLLFSLGLLIVGMRGGLQKKPFGFSQAQIFQRPILNHLALNSGFSLLQTIKREAVPKYHFYANEDHWLKFLPGGEAGASVMPAARWWDQTKDKQNIVLIIVESLSLQYLGSPFHERGFLPFVDELAGKGLFWQNHYANARRSIEGMGAILGGIPNLMNEPFLSSQYTSNDFLRVGAFLREKGYHTSFYHGGHNGTMYFDSFVKALGIEKYFGATEYNNSADDDGTWGIFDGPFLQRFRQELDQEKTPFFATVFTLTSHPPFKIPDAVQGKYPKGEVDIHESLGYVDDSLRQFFATAAKSPWYKNTLFIITGDHTYKGSRPEFANEIGDHRTPLIFFHPEWVEHSNLKPQISVAPVTSQIDILPSILDFLGESRFQENMLGRSVFRPGERWSVFYENEKYHLVENNSFLTFSAAKGFAVFAADDVKEKSPELPKPDSVMVQRLKAYLQYFSEGLIENRLERRWQGD